MLILPIAKQLKKRTQIEMAFLQDEIMDIMYSVSDNLVLHGGTAIWRCYSGKRFSEDLDFYSWDFPKLLPLLRNTVESHGLIAQKIKDTGNVIFSSISNGNETVKVEINHAVKITGTQMPYVLADGSTMEVLSLTADQFIEEKISAYSDRKYIRDLYDIYHLVNTNSLLNSTKQKLSDLMKNLETPVDAAVLKTIVYVGLSPSLDSMKLSIMRGIQ